MRSPWVLALLLAPGLLRADTVTFKNGSKLEGIATLHGETLEVRVPEGSLFFARALVKTIQTAETPLSEYERRAKALGPKDVRATYDLALFCDAHALKAQAQTLFQRTLVLAPEHDGARQHLGYRKLGDKWMSPTDILTEMGLVQLRGEWMTPGAARELGELDDRTRRLESRLSAMEKDSDGLKRSLDDERRSNDRTERATDRRIRELETENQRLASQPPAYYGGGWGYGYLTRRRTLYAPVPAPTPSASPATSPPEDGPAFGIGEVHVTDPEAHVSNTEVHVSNPEVHKP